MNIIFNHNWYLICVLLDYLHIGTLGFISLKPAVCKHKFHLLYIWNTQHPWLIDDKKIQACFLCIKISDKVAWHFHRHSKFSNLIPCTSKYNVNLHRNWYDRTTILIMHSGLCRGIMLNFNILLHLEEMEFYAQYYLRWNGYEK